MTIWASVAIIAATVAASDEEAADRLVPYSNPSYSWNKAGVSPGQYTVDLEACWATYHALLPARHQGHSGFLRSGIQGDMNRYSGDWVRDGDSREEYDVCFEDRGYLRTNLSRREIRILYSRYTEEPERRALLYEIASAERDVRPNPRRRRSDVREAEMPDIRTSADGPG